MADVKKGEGLVYKNHPLRRIDNLIYYGSMADKYIVMFQILESKKEQDMDVATRASVQLQLTDPDRGEEVGKKQPVRRHGRWLHLVGACAGRKAVRGSPNEISLQPYAYRGSTVCGNAM